MTTLKIKASKIVTYIIPIEVDEDVAKAATGGYDKEAWATVERKVEEAFSPHEQYLEDDDFDPRDFEIVD